MDETDLSEFKDEVKRLALDLLSNETLVVRQTVPGGIQGSEQDNAQDSERGSEQSSELEILFYGRAGIGGDTITILNAPSPMASELCNCLLSASSVNRQASWNFILKALS